MEGQLLGVVLDKAAHQSGAAVHRLGQNNEIRVAWLHQRFVGANLEAKSGDNEGAQKSKQTLDFLV